MKHQDFKLCRTHSRMVSEGDECPECCAERSLLVRCETHDETFETECPACAVWKANTLDQDAQVVAAPPAPMLRRESDREYLGKMPTPKASGNLGDGWVEWHGGECPLPQMAQIEYKMRTTTKTYRHNAGSLGWNHTGTGGDIVAYKVVDEPQTAPSKPQSALQVQEGGDHYKKLKIQPVEYIHANGLPFAEGSVIKYVTRWRDKNGIADLKKARHFLDLLIELETKATT